MAVYVCVSLQANATHLKIPFVSRGLFLSKQGGVGVVSLVFEQQLINLSVKSSSEVKV